MIVVSPQRRRKGPVDPSALEVIIELEQQEYRPMSSVAYSAEHQKLVLRLRTSGPGIDDDVL